MDTSDIDCSALAGFTCGEEIGLVGYGWVPEWE